MNCEPGLVRRRGEGGMESAEGNGQQTGRKSKTDFIPEQDCWKCDGTLLTEQRRGAIGHGKHTL